MATSHALCVLAYRQVWMRFVEFRKVSRISSGLVASDDMRCGSASIRTVGEYQEGGRLFCFGRMTVINSWLYYCLDRGRASLLLHSAASDL
jgi:hypothetical protein